MDVPQLIVDLAMALVAALVGGMVAQLLRQPVILGYFLAGIVIGPFTPGPVGDVNRLEVLAEIGVTFLMFALGVEISGPALLRVGRVALLGGAGQIAVSMALGAGLGALLGLEGSALVFFGALIALSSTVVVVRLLAQHGELAAPQGRIALGMLVVQDLSVVPMMVILPALAQPTEDLVPGLALAAVKAAAILAGTLLLGPRVVPWVLLRVSVTGSRELFLLTVIALALGTALVTAWAGLSLAFGAFLAGLVVAESELSHEVLGQITPLRDAFITLFFVSVGMLLDPAFVLQEAVLVLGLALAVLVGKAAIAGAIPLLFGYPLPTALFVGAALAQVGEFSFVLARLGVAEGILSERVFGLVLAVAIVTIVLTPAAMRLAPVLARGLRRVGSAPVGPSGEARADDRAAAEPEQPALRDHVVLLGYGRVGAEVARWLEAHGVPYLAIDADPLRLRAPHARGVPTLAGAASGPALLAHAQLGLARVLVITIPEVPAAERAIHYAREANPAIDVVVRADAAATVAALQRSGVDETVQPEFEAALEFVRHTLSRYGVDGAALEVDLNARRTAFYAAGAEA